MVEAALVGSLDERVITDVVVKVAARVLGCSEDEARSDRRPYQATCASEHFDQVYLPQIDWHTLTLSEALRAELAGHPSKSRGDFDLGRSSIWVADLLDRDDVDAALQRYLASQPILYGLQIQSLVREGRVDPSWFSSGFEGCIRSSSDALVDVLRALLFLDDPNGSLAVPREDRAELDPRYADLIVGLGPKPLQDHVGLFFQTMRAARCEGLFFRDAEMRAALRRHLAESVGMPVEPLPHEDQTAYWGDGEGLRSMVLAPREIDVIPPVPALES